MDLLKVCLHVGGVLDKAVSSGKQEVPSMASEKGYAPNVLEIMKNVFLR